MGGSRDRNGDHPPPPRPMARLAPQLGRLRTGASPEERAQHYASVVDAYYEDRKGLIFELDETKGIAMQAAANAERGLEGIGRIERRLGELFPRKRAGGFVGVTPVGPGEYLPDVTETGTYRVAPEAWDGIQRRIEEQDQAVASLRHSLELKAAEARGAKEAIEELDKAWDRRLKRVTAAVAVLGLLGTAGAWALAHFHVL